MEGLWFFDVIFLWFDVSVTYFSIYQLRERKHKLTPRNAKLPWTAAAHSKFKCCVMSPPTVGP